MSRMDCSELTILGLKNLLSFRVIRILIFTIELVLSIIFKSITEGNNWRLNTWNIEIEMSHLILSHVFIQSYMATGSTIS